MKFLANENFPSPSIEILRSAGYDVVSICELYPGVSDSKVIEIAKADNLIVLTFDKDYGEIIFKHALTDPPSVVFFRFKGEEPETAGRLLIDLLENKKLKIDLTFTVVEKDSIRQRTYN